jgi:hypothetical protein
MGRGGIVSLEVGRKTICWNGTMKKEKKEWGREGEYLSLPTLEKNHSGAAVY